MIFPLQRARNIMEEKNLDCLMATAPETFFYSSDFYIESMFRHGSCPFVGCTIIPKDGEPALITNALDAENVPKNTWIKDIRYTPMSAYYEGRPAIKVEKGLIPAIVYLLKERNLDEANIGIEKKYLPVSAFEQLSEALLTARFQDASSTFDDLKSIKSQEEVSRIKRAISISEKALLDVWNLAKEGMTEVDLTREYMISAIRHGCTNTGTHINLTVGEGTKIIRRAWPIGSEQHKLRKGDMIRFDGGVIYKGYHSDFARTAAFGSPSQEQKELYMLMLEAQLEAIKSVRPGIKFSDIWNVNREVIERKRPDFIRQHIGHGTGIRHSDPPHITPTNHETLKEGMVICIENSYYGVGLGGLSLEDTVLVTKVGFDKLTSLVQEMHIIQP